MDAPLIFIGILACIFGLIYGWAFHHLPHERWQFIGTIPLRKQDDNHWQGLNLTYYGLFNACAVTFAAMIVLILLGATGMLMTALILTVLLVVSVFGPCAKLIARVVEKKAYTFTIGGASFAGLMLTPLLLMSLNRVLPVMGLPPVGVMPVMAAIAVGYAFGEGAGRLACLSFGCCYGKPLDQLPGPWRTLLAPLSLVYCAQTQKAVYADNLAGRRVVAVPALTAVLYTLTALAGTYLYFNGRQNSAYLLCVLVTQLWRFFSEFLRADYRGEGRISAYQIMALAAALTSGVYAAWLPSQPLQPNLIAGLRIVWNPVILLICSLIWIGTFLYTGRSQVTASRISFFVNSDRV